MLVIRLARTGRKKLASYRLVAADSRRAVKNKFVAQLGHYDPYEKNLVFDKERTEDYIKKGAQPSSTVVKLLKREKVALPKWAEANLVVKKKAPKAKKTEEEKAAEEAARAEAKAKADEAAKAQAEGTSEDKPAEAKPEDAKTAAKTDESKSDAKTEPKAAEPKAESNPPAADKTEKPAESTPADQ